jgi:TfoX/Sxy family transcriptional regulator of competence genes
MNYMKIPGSDEKLVLFFKSILPENPSINVRLMFGNLAAFVNGNMFAGLFGEALFVRLSEDGRAELLKVKGTRAFEPMKGRPMKEYVCVPNEWLTKPSMVSPWITKALEWSSKLPTKQMKKKTAKK